MTEELMTAEIPRCPECDEILEDCLYPIFPEKTFFRCRCGKKFLRSKYGKGYFLIEQGE